MGLAILFMLGTLVVSVGLGALLYFLPVLAVILVVVPSGASLLVLLAYLLHVLGDTRSVVFLSQDGTATVRIRLRRGARHVQDHMAAPVSHRHGRQLREQLVGPLLAQADATGTRITFDAVPATANQYQPVLLGLVAGGRSWQGRRYTREPVALHV